MIRKTLLALALATAMPASAHAGTSITQMIERAIDTKDRIDMATDVMTLVEARVTTWWVGGYCASRELRGLTAIDAGRATVETCCATYTDGVLGPLVVGVVSLGPWTPDIDLGKQDEAVKLAFDQVASMPEDELKTALAKETKGKPAEALAICQAAKRQVP